MLYPPQASPEVWSLVRELHTRDNDEQGTPLVSRPPLTAERRQLDERADELRPWMQKAEFGTLKGYAVRMFIENGLDRDKAMIHADEVAKTLGAIPAWAADRACDAFGKGTVGPAEANDHDYVKGTSPEPRHVAERARAILRPFQQEWEAIGRIRRGTPKMRELSAEDRGQLGERMRAAADDLIARHRLSDVSLQEQAAALIKRLGDAYRRREWERAGLEPPESEGPYTATLAMHLALGGKIEEIQGQRFLTMPTVRKDGDV